MHVGIILYLENLLNIDSNIMSVFLLCVSNSSASVNQNAFVQPL